MKQKTVFKSYRILVQRVPFLEHSFNAVYLFRLFSNNLGEDREKKFCSCQIDGAIEFCCLSSEVNSAPSSVVFLIYFCQLVIHLLELKPSFLEQWNLNS